MGGVGEDDVSGEQVEELTPEQEYQRDYYQDHKDERREYAQNRWANNREYRRREIQRAQDRRARQRAEKASDRFKAMIDERKEADPNTSEPVLALEDGENVLVYSTGHLAREVGRSPRAVRMWLRDGTLPGATTFIDIRKVKRKSKRVIRRAYFSERFSKAVYRACEALFYLNGRGEKKILKLLIMKELAKDNIEYVPYAHRGDNGVRVRATAEGE